MGPCPYEGHIPEDQGGPAMVTLCGCGEVLFCPVVNSTDSTAGFPRSYQVPEQVSCKPLFTGVQARGSFGI